METASTILRAWSSRRRDARPLAGVSYYLQEGEVMYEQGEPAVGVCRVLEGGIRLCRESEDAQEVIFDLVLPGQHFCTEFLLGEKTDGRAVAQVYTALEVVDLQLPQHGGRKSADELVAVMTALKIAVEARRRRLRSIKMLALTGNATSRIRFFASWCPPSILERMGSEMLAAFVGCSRRMVSRIRLNDPKLDAKLKPKKRRV